MRVCARSDCSAPAAAILTYDRVAQTAYLYTVDDPATRTPGDLCERHLRRLVLPRSWCLDDRRDTATQIDTSVAKPPPARKPVRARKPARKSPSEKKLRAVPAVPAPRRKWAEAGPSLFDTADVAEIEEIDEPPGAPDADAAEPVWMPRFGPDTELEEVIDANTPLLRRAFGGS